MVSSEQDGETNHDHLAQITIIAHGSEQEVFDRHLPFWEAHKLPILVVCPENDWVKTDHPLLGVGKAAHSGPEALIRLTSMVRMLCDSPFEYHLIFEYDSFCLDPSKVVWRRGLYGNIFRNLDGREISNFSSWHYPNPPWMIDSLSLRRMLLTLEDYPIEENGMADRWLAALATCAGVPIMHHRPRGYSRAPILPEHREELKAVIDAGGTMIHGIKTKEMLKMVLDLYDTKK